MTEPPTLQEVVAANVRSARLEAGETLEQVASMGRSIGARWSPSRVSEFERGDKLPSLPTLIELSLAFTELFGRPVTLADLLSTDANYIRVTDTVAVESGSLRGALSGVELRVLDTPGLKAARDTEDAAYYLGRVREEGFADVSDALQRLKLRDEGQLRDVLDAAQDALLADKRAAKRLNVSVHELMAAAFELWGTSLSNQRELELRQEPDANDQRRGRVTRELTTALADQLRRR